MKNYNKKYQRTQKKGRKNEAGQTNNIVFRVQQKDKKSP